MSRTKLNDERWPDAWIDGKPATSGHDDITKIIEDDDTFHIGQCYENEAAKTVECALCGGREFNIGSGSFFTAIRCVKCQWEICFHYG